MKGSDAHRRPVPPIWGGGVQVDVVAINWREKALLLGEAKWGTDAE